MSAINVPEGSIYSWMYIQGLKQIPYEELEIAIRKAGKIIRQKDYDNWCRGFLKGVRGNDPIITPQNIDSLVNVEIKHDFYETEYSEYADHPYPGAPNPIDRWVPCYESGKPITFWSEERCTFTEARCYLQTKNMAENLFMTHMIVIDCDGDHDSNNLDMETIMFFNKYRDKTYCLSKPKPIKEYGCVATCGYIDDLPASYHLTFYTDKLIKTMHFPKAHVDILGNAGNSIRYLKNKVSNNLPAMPMTDEIWKDIRQYLESRCRWR